MTITHLSEIIRKWVGWCPDRMMTPRSGAFHADSPVSSIPLDERGNVIRDVIIDYGSTGISVYMYGIIAAALIAGLPAIIAFGLFESGSFLGILVISIFTLAIGVHMAYQDIRKASVDFAPGAVIIRRPLFKPLVIAKDTITTVEVRKNVHHSQRWLYRGAMAVFLISFMPSILLNLGHVSTSVSQVDFMVFIMFYVTVILFFGLTYYHGHIRSGYPAVLSICTNRKKIVGLYINDPAKLSDMLSGWQKGLAPDFSGC